MQEKKVYQSTRSLVKRWQSASPKLVYSYSKAKGRRIAFFNQEDHPDYNPKLWKDCKFANFQSKNNCYSYALGDRMIGGLNPGFFAYKEGHADVTEKDIVMYANKRIPFQEYCKRSLELVELDGMIPVKDEFEAQPGHHLIAMVFRESPSTDFHFYRLDSDGLWSHKPGVSSVTRVDRFNNLVKNPVNAVGGRDNSLYTYFGGFFLVPNKKFDFTEEDRSGALKIINDYCRPAHE